MNPKAVPCEVHGKPAGEACTVEVDGESEWCCAARVAAAREEP